MLRHLFEVLKPQRDRVLVVFAISHQMQLVLLGFNLGNQVVIALKLLLGWRQEILLFECEVLVGRLCIVWEL